MRMRMLTHPAALLLLAGALAACNQSDTTAATTESGATPAASAASGAAQKNAEQGAFETMSIENCDRSGACDCSIMIYDQPFDPDASEPRGKAFISDRCQGDSIDVGLFGKELRLFREGADYLWNGQPFRDTSTDASGAAPGDITTISIQRGALRAQRPLPASQSETCYDDAGKAHDAMRFFYDASVTINAKGRTRQIQGTAVNPGCPSFAADPAKAAAAIDAESRMLQGLELGHSGGECAGSWVYAGAFRPQMPNPRGTAFVYDVCSYDLLGISIFGKSFSLKREETNEFPSDLPYHGEGLTVTIKKGKLRLQTSAKAVDDDADCLELKQEAGRVPHRYTSIYDATVIVASKDTGKTVRIPATYPETVCENR